MAFHVGQKVACIKRGSWSYRIDGRATMFGEICPNCGDILTIREMIVSDDTLFLRFKEIQNPLCEYRNGLSECKFAASRFRPVIERKTDISIFTKMLMPNLESV